MAPIRLQPNLEPLEGSLTFKERNAQGKDSPTLHVHLQFYVAPRTDQVLVFPFHKMRAAATGLQLTDELKFGFLHFADASSHRSFLAITRPANERSVTVHARLEPLEITMSELIVRGPRKVTIYSDADVSDPIVGQVQQLRFELFLAEAQDDMPCRLSSLFERRAQQDEQQTVWDLQTNMR